MGLALWSICERPFLRFGAAGYPAARAGRFCADGIHAKIQDTGLIFDRKNRRNIPRQGTADGAEDYIVKPFSMLELLVRMEKILNRNGKLNRILRYRILQSNGEAHGCCGRRRRFPQRSNLIFW
jgi:hypothetical protein